MRYFFTLALLPPLPALAQSPNLRDDPHLQQRIEQYVPQPTPRELILSPQTGKPKSEKKRGRKKPKIQTNPQANGRNS